MIIGAKYGAKVQQSAASGPALTVVPPRDWVHLRIDDGSVLRVYIDHDDPVGLHLDDGMLIVAPVAPRRPPRTMRPDVVGSVVAELRELAAALSSRRRRISATDAAHRASALARRLDGID